VSALIYLFSGVLYCQLSPVVCLAIISKKYVAMFEVQMRETADWVFVFTRKRVLTMATNGVTE
jgi:hypothetical protein